MKLFVDLYVSTLYALCQTCEIGDEYHYVLQCPTFAIERKYINIFFNRPSI